MLIKQTHKMNSGRSGVNILTAAILCAGFTFSAASAFASPTQHGLYKTEPVKIKIYKSDLATDGGIARVYSRLHERAERACSYQGISRVQDVKFQLTCTQDLLSDFVQNVDNKRLTQYYKVQNRKSG